MSASFDRARAPTFRYEAPYWSYPGRLWLVLDLGTDFAAADAVPSQLGVPFADVPRVIGQTTVARGDSRLVVRRFGNCWIIDVLDLDQYEDHVGVKEHALAEELHRAVERAGLEGAARPDGGPSFEDEAGPMLEPPISWTRTISRYRVVSPVRGGWVAHLEPARLTGRVRSQSRDRAVEVNARSVATLAVGDAEAREVSLDELRVGDLGTGTLTTDKMSDGLFGPVLASAHFTRASAEEVARATDAILRMQGAGVGVAWGARELADRVRALASDRDLGFADPVARLYGELALARLGPAHPHGAGAYRRVRAWLEEVSRIGGRCRVDVFGALSKPEALDGRLARAFAEEASALQRDERQVRVRFGDDHGVIVFIDPARLEPLGALGLTPG